MSPERGLQLRSEASETGQGQQKCQRFLLARGLRPFRSQSEKNTGAWGETANQGPLAG
jgi:hypothetical protein